jgi:hypothetical protein
MVGLMPLICICGYGVIVYRKRGSIRSLWKNTVFFHLPEADAFKTLSFRKRDGGGAAWPFQRRKALNACIARKNSGPGCLPVRRKKLQLRTKFWLSLLFVRKVIGQLF